MFRSAASPPEMAEAWRSSAYAAALLALAALPRCWLAFADQGVIWSDEITQSLEPAHLLVYGYGMKTWAFIDGGRAWLFPALIALPWEVMAWLGLDRAPALAISAKLMMALFSVVAVAAAMALAHRHGGRAASLMAGALCLAFPALLVYGSRAFSEVPSAACLTVAALLAARATQRSLVVAGVLAGLAVFLRYQNGIVLVGLGALVLWERRWEGCRGYVLAASLTVLLGGLVDWVTWGSPFHSFRTYVEYNLVHGKADTFGVAGPTFYWDVAWTSTGPAFAAVILGWLRAARRMGGLLFVALLYVLAHSLVGHKELRFLVPVVPVLLAVAGVGLAEALQGVARLRRLMPALALVLVAAMARQADGLTLGQLGLFRGFPPAAESPWHFAEGANRLLWALSSRPDVCGVWLGRGVNAGWTGAFTYLHRNVPLVSGAHTPAQYANYALLPPEGVGLPGSFDDEEVPVPAAYQPVMRSRGWQVLQRAGGCRPLAPGVTWRSR